MLRIIRSSFLLVFSFLLISSYSSQVINEYQISSPSSILSARTRNFRRSGESSGKYGWSFGYFLRFASEGVASSSSALSPEISPSMRYPSSSSFSS